MTREEICNNLDAYTVGLDDTFKFHCTRCGKCCIHREDIMLSPMDIFRIARELEISPSAFFIHYCTMIIGSDSRVPIVLLRPVGKDSRCPLLKNNKCAVHNVKPAVCAMFPVGRYIATPLEENSEVKYLLQPIECGDYRETHTVREWLSGFDIALEDESFIRWHQTIAKLSEVLCSLERKWDAFTMMQVHFIVRITLYENYDTEKDFMPQFEHNSAAIFEILQNIPKLREVVLRAAGA